MEWALCGEPSSVPQPLEHMDLWGMRSYQRPHLKQLVIPRRPVVQQHETENVLLRILDRHPLAPRHGLGDKVAHLKLKVQTPGGAVCRL